MKTPRSLARSAALATAAAAAALVLAACGGDDNTGAPTGERTTVSPSAPATAGRHINADVAFAQQMVQHHRQAVMMAEMAGSHASSSKVKELAMEIKKAQDPEIKTMTGWLKAWGEKVPEGMPGMDHGMDQDMPGMMNRQQMREMQHAGNAFDTMFLTMMIKHHEGAVEMARAEKTQGAYGPAKMLADDIITSQTAEIAQMRKMLSKISSPAVH